MLCKHLAIEIQDEDVSSLRPFVDAKGRASVMFLTGDGNSICLDEETLKRGLACIEADRKRR